MSIRRVGATYRLQIRAVGFAGAAALVPYLTALGIEALYLSPIWTARPGSTHGYDVVDPNAIDPALGGEEGLEVLLGALDGVGMTLVVDAVPNHLAIDPANAAFVEALRDGPGASRGAWFDVDWDEADGRIVLTTLSAPLAELVAVGAVSITDDAVIAEGSAYPRCSRTAAEREGLWGVLDAQHYRLAYWRLRTSLLNYRRFFEIDDLIGVRQEDPAVYRATHGRLLRLAADRRVSGIRIDHVDGLADPTGYLTRLVDELEASGVDRPRLLVEKVLERSESLPWAWCSEGTTGYEFAALALGVLVDPRGAAAIAEGYRALERDPRPFVERRRAAKRHVLDGLFAAQLARAARPLGRAIEAERPGTDLSPGEVVDGLRALIVALDVYRTYGRGHAPLAGADRARLADALDVVRAGQSPAVVRAASALVVLLASGTARPSDDLADGRRRFEQLTAAVMAKGVEDTAAFAPGTSLVGVDVGTDPDHPGCEPSAFHRAMAVRVATTPGLSATTTHDSKRSEDVRARLAALCDDPEQWLALVRRWRRAHARFRTTIAGAGAPDAAEELYLYETIVGLVAPGASASPQVRRRIVEHVVKALREAKRHTSWMDPDPRYERAVTAFVRNVLSAENASFHAELERLFVRLDPSGRSNALALIVLKVAAPGIPDVYQGSELGVAALTDPDNRRPVETSGARALLERGSSDPLRHQDRSTRGVPDARKLLVTAAALRARRDHVGLFERGSYGALGVRGARRDHVLGFLRSWRGSRAIAVVVLRAGRLRFVEGNVAASEWGSTVLRVPEVARGRYVDVLSGAEVELVGATVAVSKILATLPVALLVRV